MNTPLALRSLLCLLSLAPLSYLLAQAPISGRVVDAGSGEAVAYATISLQTMAADTFALVDGTLTGDDGRFKLENVKPGTYRIEVSYLGYEKLTTDELRMTGRPIELGDLGLGAAAELLEEVTVTGQRSLIEERVDRLVYNAEKDITSRGGDAGDVLRKVPMLSVDLEGNVSVRGSSNIRVLINNKPSTILAASVADAMKMIPADQIKSVEVITSPSAKYDAEGSGGIINIITKRNDMAGYYLNVDTGLGLRGSNLGLNGSYRRGRFGVTLGGFGRAFYNDAETSMEQISTNAAGETVRSVQSALADDNGLFGRYNLGLDYDLADNQYLSGGVRFGVRNFNRDQLQTTLIETDEASSTTLRDIDGGRSSQNWDANLDYLWVMKPGRELSLSTLYSIDDGSNDFLSILLDEGGDPTFALQNLNGNLNRELTFQLDYIHPIGDKQIVEAGVKSILRDVDSDFRYLSGANADELSFDASQPAGFLNYGQDIAAAYTAYTLSLPADLTLKAGLRYEATYITADQDNEEIDIPDYANLVPSVNLSKKVGQNTTLKLGYNRRIQRPWIRQLNPNVDVQNNRDITQGNPLLRPEVADNLELGYSSMIGKTYLNLSLFGRLTDNAINEVRRPLDSLDGALLTTYENIGSERALGLNAFMNVYLTKDWTVNGGIDVYYASLEGQVVDIDGTSVAATNTGFNYGGRLMSQLKLNEKWTAQAFTFMRGRTVQLQGFRGGFGMYSVGLNREFGLEGRGQIGLAAENFLQRGWNVASVVESPAFTQTSDMLLLNRSVRVNFSYKFGKLEQQRKRKKTRGVTNDDLMEGGEQNGG